MTVYRGWFLFFCGMCMGIADLVPGISGGTIAFILGFYQPLLESLKTINGSTFRLLITRQWIHFSQAVAWKFLLTLISGIITSFIIFANLLHFVLSHEVYRVYLYATFFGLICASFVFCLKQIQGWTIKMFMGFCIGVLSSYLLTESTLEHVSRGEWVAHQYLFFFDGWLVICGACAICALLLPGISGSYILTLLGVYPTIIEALVTFLNELTSFSFHFAAFSVLCSLGLGVVLGAVAFARILSWLMKQYPNQALALLCGFMMGGMRSVWPFWTYGSLTAESQNVVQYPFLPPIDSPLIWQGLLFAIMGFAFILALESYAQKKRFL